MTNVFPALCFRFDQCNPAVSLGFLISNKCLSNAVSFIYCCSPTPSSVKPSHSVFLQLIDTFALEIGELKKEMVQSSPTLDKEPMDIQA